MSVIPYPFNYLSSYPLSKQQVNAKLIYPILQLDTLTANNSLQVPRLFFFSHNVPVVADAMLGNQASYARGLSPVERFLGHSLCYSCPIKATISISRQKKIDFWSKIGSMISTSKCCAAKLLKVQSMLSGLFFENIAENYARNDELCRKLC